MTTHETTTAQEQIPFYPGQQVEVYADRPDPSLPSVLGQPALAELTLGGLEDQDPERVLLIYVADKSRSEYREVIDGAGEGAEKTDFAIVALNENGGVRGVAFLPKVHPSKAVRNLTTIGRRSGGSEASKPRWMGFGVVRERPEDWTPFDENDSVSRRQLGIITGSDRLIIWANSSEQSSAEANSRSTIRGVGVEIRDVNEPEIKDTQKFRPLGQVASR